MSKYVNLKMVENAIKYKNQIENRKKPITEVLVDNLNAEYKMGKRTPKL